MQLMLMLAPLDRLQLSDAHDAHCLGKPADKPSQVMRGDLTTQLLPLMTRAARDTSGILHTGCMLYYPADAHAALCPGYLRAKHHLAEADVHCRGYLPTHTTR